MCGINGIVPHDINYPVSRSILQEMTSVLKHRGPDDQGFYLSEGIGFGFSRLSIIDLSTGNQPHYNEDHSIVSVCNGEIYNYRDLRESLQQKGHQFRTQCDVEVLVHLYEEYGCDFVQQLNGQFAIALYDQHKERVMLARDHVGIAPMFYTKTENETVFASEIKALFKHPHVHRVVDMTALDQLLTFPGLISPRTAFQGIHSLKPGHFLLIEHGDVKECEYWDLVYPEADGHSSGSNELEVTNQLTEQLTRSVERRLHADVPVGFYLSGGLDSSLVASLIHQILPHQTFQSFSIVFPDKNIDERHFQQMMSQQVQSVHRETEFHSQDIIQNLKNVIYHCETPLKESYDTCSLVLSKLVHDTGLKVVLTGEGADELFGGYVGYRFDESRKISELSSFDPETMLENEKRQNLWGDATFFYEKDYVQFQDVKEALYSEAALETLPDFDATKHFVVDQQKLQNRNHFHKRSYIDFKLRIADHLVADHGDRVAYANSVEARYPFLDIDVIEFSKTIPISLMLKNATEKYILRQCAKPFVPQQIVEREKFGFVAPGSSHLMTQNSEYINDILSYETIKRQGYFNPDTVERLKTMYLQENFSVNTTFETDLLMIVLTFGIWLETFDLPDYS